MSDPEYITAEDVCALIPGMSKNLLSQLRFKGGGPKYLKPTPRRVVYRKADVIAWIESTEQTWTGEKR